MRRWLSGFMVIGAIGLTSCGKPSPTVSIATVSSSTNPSAAATPSASPSASAQSAPSSPMAPSDRPARSPAEPKPSQGVVKAMVMGDLKCYVTLLDANNISHQLGATFEVCANQSALNRSVNLSYRTVAVSDCQSNEPCGKTHQESLISALEITSASPAASDSQTFSNDAWTIVVSNLNSWSGVSNTGDLSYRGCDSKGKCIDLKSGKMSCRDGVCAMSWSNGNYQYTLESPMDNPDRSSRGGTRLTVRLNDQVILNETLAAK